MRLATAMFLIFNLITVGFAQAESEVDLLKQQISFLMHANAEMRASYTTTLEFLKWILAFLIGGGVLGFGVGVRQLFKQVNTLVETRVSERLNSMLDNRLETLEKTIRREEVIGTSRVAYVHPDRESHVQPHAFQLVQGRGFAKVLYSKDLVYIDDLDDVIVLDLQFLDINDEGSVRQYLGEAKRRLKDDQFCIVFISPGSQVVTDMRKSWPNLGVANFPLSLISASVDAAHLAYASKKENVAN